MTKSKNGNTHLYLVTTQDMTVHERIILQACLGSDPVKEMLSMLRLRAGSTAPVALFETKVEAAKVRGWKSKRQKEKAKQRNERMKKEIEESEKEILF